ncbi:MAG: SEC-C metal-binding domain-containing protein [Salibacteraceae bacterium]
MENKIPVNDLERIYASQAPCCSDPNCCGSNASTTKIRRNDPCFCGSGRKFKKCCGKSK